MDPITVNCTIIDWCEVTAILFNTFMAACFTILLGGIVALGVNWYRRRQYRLQEEVLLKLADWRSKGVDLRNELFEPPVEIDAYGVTPRPWKERVEEWEEELEIRVKLFSRVEAERLKTLDWFPLLDASQRPEISTLTPEQIKDVSEFSETLKRLDHMLEERFRPTQSP